MPARQRESETILVVDDDPIPLEFCRTVLTHAGYDVVVASSGEEACDFLQPHRSPFDLALIDIVMPGMSGIDLAKRVENLSLGTRVVLMSGYAPDEVARLVGPDASDYRSMWKPFEAAALVRMIRNVLDTPVENKAMRKGQTGVG